MTIADAHRHRRRTGHFARWHALGLGRAGGALTLGVLLLTLAPWADSRAQQAAPGVAAPAAAGPATAAVGAPQPPPPAEGTGEQRWERVFYGSWEGKEALLYSSSMFFGKLAIGDLDGDGKPDLLVGKADGHIDRFENVGTHREPKWRLVEENLSYLRSSGNEQNATPQPIDAGAHAAPALVDIDQDGDLDLFVGTDDGRLMFFRNVGNPVLPAFMLVTDKFLANGFGNNLVPAFVDMDRNRSPDLVVGNRAGQVYLLPNQGTQRRAAYCVEFPPPNALPEEEPPCRPTPRLLTSVAPENNAAPGLVDWDGDGDPDLFVGKSNGTVAYYANKGTPTAPDWRLEQERFLAIDDGGFAAPTFLDVNGDGRPDILIGSSTNNVSLYTNKDTKSVLDVWKVTTNVLGIRRVGLGLRQTIVAAGDLDGDKDLDLIVGDRGGRLLWLENVGRPDAPAWRVKQDNLLEGTVRENVAPWLADLDGDGDLDLLLGGQDGRIWLMRNVGSAKQAKFMLESTNFAGVNVGNDSVPALVDIDGDGDLDLFVGNRRGLVIFYRNEGSNTAPDFRLAATNFGGVNVGVSAAPAFFDANGDGKLDLIVGSRRGTLLLRENQNEAGDTELNKWKSISENWGGFLTAGYSAPRFADLNGDGKPDLLIGDVDGNVQLWINRGPKVAAPPSQGPVASTGSGGPNAVAAASGGMDAGGTGSVRIAPSFETQSGLTALAENPAGAAPASASATEILMSAPQTLGPLEPIFTLATQTLGDLKFKGRVRPAIGDLNGDGLPDLIIGLSEGRLAYYRNVGSKTEPKWEEAEANVANYDGGANPSPLLTDLDGDGLLDLVVGTESGQLVFLRNTGQPNAPAFTRVPEALAGINVGRSAAPAMALVDGDKVLDLIVGDFSGHLWAYVREGGAQSLNFKLLDRRYLGVDVGVAATPFVGDIDRDGIPDLLVGSDQGRISLFVRQQAAGQPGLGWAPGPDYFKGIKFPFGTTPRLLDIDGDGDQDLVLGSEKGTLYLYRNDALTTEASPPR